ncbi:MAG: F0F1 ATP synthase subunit A [Candidatus Marinimicrobia bacterium]|nr:F0F1 ATP synthase subunit A [Candidatus Neomarinimicrobiota bacterium]
MINKINSLFFIIIFSCLAISFAEEHHGSYNKTSNHGENHHGEEQHHDSGVTGKVIMHHIQDGKVFEIFNPLHPTHPIEINLTTTWNDISPTLAGWFSWIASGAGIEDDPEQLFITKQSVMMFLASLLLILAFTFGYDKKKKVQSGLGNLLEIFVIFIRDEVVYPNMGEKQGRRFLPLILTFFFFIVLLNLMGLVPGSATATASFSVTIGLALITFFTYILFGNKDFWKHIFATPGVPLWLLPIMIPVEIIGLITKPFALSVRLLANMNAGHIIILAFLGIIINMKSYGAALGAVPMAIAINMLELFVAFLQAYIFSLLSSIFIGMAVVEHEHH